MESYYFMQKKVQIVSDGSLDLPQELTKEKDIEKSAKENIPVICITKKFSGSLQFATVAKEMIEEKYPQAKIMMIDSTVDTVLQGLFVLEACRLRDLGMTAEEYVIGDSSNILYPVYAGVAGVAQMISMAILSMFSKKVGKKFAFFMASFLPVIGLTLLWICGYVMPMNIVLVGVCSCIVNAGIGFMLVFITVLLSEVVDYGEYKLGTRNESILFSMQTFVVKFGGAFSGFLSGIGLTVIGFVANQQQSAGTMAGMRIIMLLIPSILSALCYVIYVKGYKLDGETYKKIRDELRKRKEK